MKWLAIAAALPIVIFALHRLCLWLEDRGYLNYMRNKPVGGSGGAMLELQQFLEPKVQHVIQVEDRTKAMRQDKNGDPM